MKPLAQVAVPAVLLAMAIWFTGCYSTRYVAFGVQRADSDTLTVPEMNDRLAKSWVAVHPKAGPELKGKFVRCAADSCWFLAEDGKSSFSVPSRSLHSLEYRDHAWGAVGGFFGGAAAGLAASFLIGGVSDQLRGWDALYWFTGGLLGGAIGGAFYGAATGTSSVYRFVVDSTSLAWPNAGERVGSGTVVNSQ